ncbi:MAG: TIGR01212 family radical SAM protein [Bacteroidales bacterium]|jgi:radical SAM protein (TIGR01212 family)|nr:TIGR01212 family radical SAM protein [Bacteroidales bacterium]
MEQHLRYNPFINYFTERYGCRLQKVVVNAGFTCPNRDGSIKSARYRIQNNDTKNSKPQYKTVTCSGLGGCTYCDNDAFHPNYSTPDKSIGRQIDEGIEFHKVRYHKAQQYIAYFQPFSNTYAPLEQLKKIYTEALNHPDIRGIVIGTRPDCIDNEKLDWLQELSDKKIVIIEYGVESVYDKTLERIHRGHNFETAVRAIEETAKRGITQCGHFIFGLPGETAQEMDASAQIINTLPLTALKFHQLQIIKGTQMEQEFAARRQDFITFTLEEYIDFIAKYIAKLKPTFYIDRFAGEVPPRFVNETPWGLIRYQELRTMLEKRMEELNLTQGCNFTKR